MYGNTPEGVDSRDDITMEAIRRVIGPCREWCKGKANICGERAEYVLWGKLIAPEGLGPRCYDHAAEHVGHDALRPHSGYALVYLDDLTRAIDEAHWPALQEGRA